MNAYALHPLILSMVEEFLPEEAESFRRSQIDLQDLNRSQKGYGSDVPGGSEIGPTTELVPEFIKLAIAIVAFVRWWIARRDGQRQAEAREAAIARATRELENRMRGAGLSSELAKAIAATYAARILQATEQPV